MCLGAALGHCLHVFVSYPGLFFFGGGPAPVSPPGAGRPAGWLTTQERKRPLSNSRWRPACAYTAETHSHAVLHADTVASHVSAAEQLKLQTNGGRRPFDVSAEL